MNVTINSNNKEKAEILAFLEKVKEIADSAKGKTVEVEMNGQKMKVSKATLGFLTGIYQSIVGGQSVIDKEEEIGITIGEAADMLNVSPSYVIKLLEKGELSYEEKRGDENRILLKVLKEYKVKRRAEQEEAMNFLAKQAQELNLGY